MAKNNNLHSAKRDKKDEFYTQLADIEKELMFINLSLRVRLYIVIVMMQEKAISSNISQ